MGISQRMSTPSSLRRGNWASTPLKVPSGLNWRTFTSYTTVLYIHSGCTCLGALQQALSATAAKAAIIVWYFMVG